MDTQHGEMFEKDEMWGKCCRKHMGMRALTAVVVAIFIFWCGFQFGEMRATIGGGYGFGARMMQGGWGYTSSNGAIPTPVGTFAQ
ncbi:MAG: hypothetical protein ACHQU0_01695 [Candidatus Paceibacteria bacterium]